MKYIQTLFFLLCLGGITTSVFAQKRNYILYKDTVTGKDTVIMNVSFANKDYKKKQYAVSIVNGENAIIHTYKAEDIAGYKEGRTLYVSRSLSVDGEVRRVLLPRVYWKDNISIYSFIPDKGQSRFYVQMPNDSLLLPLKGNSETNGINPLVTYLETFPVAQNETVRKYIRSMKPTPDSFENRYRICRTGNLNYIPEVRWGVLAGAGMVDLTYSNDDFGQKFQGFVGIFADFPIFEGLSLHPELTYREYSQTAAFYESDKKNKGNSIYNRRDLIMPLMLRYTLISLKGKVLPYIQAGAELNMAFKKEYASQFMYIDEKGYTNWVENDPVSQDKFAIAYTMGLGVEWKLLPTHSLFFDLRYSRENSDTRQNGYYAVLSFNL